MIILRLLAIFLLSNYLFISFAFAVPDGTGTEVLDSETANTTSVLRIKNTAGDFDVFETTATPEAAITASIGDIAVDSSNGILYFKTSGSATNTGWSPVSTGSTGTTLQTAYNSDADGSNATIALTSADDSIVISNPAAAGTDSTFALQINQLATGVASLDVVTSATTGNGVNITANAMTSGDALSIATTSTGYTGNLILSELRGNNAGVTGNALKVGITGATATGTALNVTNAGTSFTARFNDDGTYTDTTPVVVDASGNVGIGTTVPSDNFHVLESDAGTNAVVTNSRFEHATSGTAAAGFGTALDFFLEDAAGNSNQAARVDVAWEDATNASEDASIRFNQMVAGTLTETVRIDDTGNVGIGTSAPSDNLHIRESDAGTNAVVTAQRIEHATSGTAAAGFGTALDFFLEDAAGNANQAARIDVAWEDATNASEDSSIRFNQMVAGTLTEAMRIDDTGRVGIGTNAPGGFLHVSSGGLDEMLRLQSTATGAYITFSESGTNRGFMGYLGGVTLFAANEITDAIGITGNTALQLGANSNVAVTIDSTQLVGIGTNAPAARLHVQEPTIGNEVARFESVATNDDPSFKIFQGRLQTTDNTATTLVTIATASDTNYLVEARVVCRRTDTAGSSNVYVIRANYRNVAGTLTERNETADYSDEDVLGYGATFVVSGTDIVLQVDGAAANTVTWHATVFVQSVST